MRKLTVALMLCVMGIAPKWAASQRNCAFVDDGIRTTEDIRFAKEAAASHKVTGAIRTIPVVVSIFYSSSTSASNIDQTQVESGIAVLNEAFRGQYGGADTKIEFCLSGIKRFQNSANASATIGGNELVIKSIGQEDPNQFYNVYLVEQLFTPQGDSAEGYTFTPKIMTIDDRYDGTLLKHFYWGKVGTGTNNKDFDLGRIAVHEAGHWLNLYHPFGTCDYDWNCEADNDCCCDTPPMKVNHNDRCRRNKNTCDTDNPDEKDPVHNYMGYTPDDCRNEFTECQSGRMNYTLDVLRPAASFSTGDCPHFKTTEFSDGQTQPVFNCMAYPNPFSTNTTLKVDVIGKETPITIQIFDAQGRMVTQIADRQLLHIGPHEYQFEAPAPGIYLARVLSPWHTKSIRLVSAAR
jgi:hypothetical protein